MKLKKMRSKTALISVEKADKTHSGVYIADQNNITEIATVLQISDDITSFSVGDRILFKSWSINRYKIDGEEFAILDEEHFDGVL